MRLDNGACARPRQYSRRLSVMIAESDQLARNARPKETSWTSRRFATSLSTPAGKRPTLGTAESNSWLFRCLHRLRTLRGSPRVPASPTPRVPLKCLHRPLHLRLRVDKKIRARDHALAFGQAALDGVYRAVFV